MSTPRRFLLSDAIVLVAATAAGFAVFKPYYAVIQPLRWARPRRSTMQFTHWIDRSWDCLILASPFVMAWALAILFLRLRGPQPRWSRLVRQPGLVAGMMTAWVLALRLSGFATMCYRLYREPNVAVWTPRSGGQDGCFMGPPPGYLLFDTDHFLNTMAMIGVAVAVGWILLLASGRWRAERSWIDRTGRALGCFWIILLPLTCWWDFHARF